MTHSRAIVAGISLLLAIVLPGKVRPSEAPSVQDGLKVDWSSIQYHRSISIEGRSAASQASQVTENLSLGFRVEILDPDRIIAISSSQGTVTGLFDAAGRSLPLQLFSSSPSTPRYQGWSYTKLSHRVPNLMAFAVELAPAILSMAGTEIGRVEGCLYALSVDAIEYVDLPYEPNDTWVRLTHDHEVRVVEAYTNGSFYRLEIESANPASPTSSNPEPGDLLASRMVIDRQLLCEGGQPASGAWSVPFQPRLSGTSTGRATNGPIEAIRYVVVVNPKHNVVPFVLEHIPLPQPRGQHQPGQPTEAQPVQEAEQ